MHTLLRQLSNVPNGPNEAFVLDYKLIEGFACTISSKKLLLNGIGKKLISADTTYKLLWQGLAVSPIGTVDSGVFHLIALGVSKNQEEDFAFIFETIKNKAIEIFNIQIDPQIILCDANKSISNAFMSVFGDNRVILTCWYHVRETIKKSLGIYFAKEVQQKVLNDIGYLQLSSSPEAFEDASLIFLQKYAAHKDFVKYFKYQWLQQFRNWYVGAVKGIPKTNNALEAFNRDLKQGKTLQEPTSLENCFEMLFRSIFRLSLKYDNVF